MRCSWCAPAGFIASLAVHAALIGPFLLISEEIPAPVPEESHLVLEMRMFRTEPQTESTPQIPPTPRTASRETPDPELRQQTEPRKPKPGETQSAAEALRKPSPVAVTEPARKPEPEKISREPEPAKKSARKPPPVKPQKRPQTASAASRQQIAKAETSYRNMVRSLIEKKKFYPARARRNRSTGKVRVSFTLQRDGSIANLRISHSSGVGALDQAAKKAVQKVGRFPPFPKASTRASWEFTVPLHYRLPR